MKTLFALLVFCGSLAWGQFWGIPPGVRSGTEAAIPVACNRGEQYWSVDAAPGLNLLYCVVTGNPGTWARAGTGGGGAAPGAGTQALAGLGVEYISGLTFEVGAGQYSILGVGYTLGVITSVTLGAADPTNPRIDVIGVDNTGAVFVTAGTAAVSPALPSVDPATQLGLIFVTVAALATTPTGVSLVDIYSENTEWTSAVSANFNAASTSNPYRGTKDIEATAAVLTNNVTLTKPAAGTENLQNWNSLVFYIRSKAAWPTGSGGNAARVVNISWLSGSTPVGVPVVLKDGAFGFSSATLAVYQQVSIPTSLFGTGANTVTTLKLAIAGTAGSTSIGFYLDAISLQGGVSPIVIPTSSLVRPCEIVLGAVGTGASALADDNDAPAVCGNLYQANLKITSVECRANGASSTVTPIITGGAATSILTGALTCGNGSFLAGALSGTPVQLPGGTIDGNITSAGGASTLITIRIGRTL